MEPEPDLITGSGSDQKILAPAPQHCKKHQFKRNHWLAYIWVASLISYKKHAMKKSKYKIVEVRFFVLVV